jgi:cytoskeletal protein RodZ
MPSQTIPQEYSKEIGALLKAARQTRSMDHSEIASKLALSPSQLRLLEAGETGSFYNQHFYLQAVGRYAAFLDLDLPAPPSQPEVEKDETPPFEPHERVGEVQGTERKRSGPKAVPVSIAAFGFVALGILFSLQSEETKHPLQTADPVAPPVEIGQAGGREPMPQTTPAPIAAVQSTPAQMHANADSSFLNTDPTWIQIVSKDGSKTNLKPQAGEIVQFNAQSTAAVVFGKPSTAKLTVNGQEVEIEKFLINEASPPRALVILRDL